MLLLLRLAPLPLLPRLTHLPVGKSPIDTLPRLTHAPPSGGSTPYRLCAGQHTKLPDGSSFLTAPAKAFIRTYHGGSCPTATPRFMHVLTEGFNPLAPPLPRLTRAAPSNGRLPSTMRRLTCVPLPGGGPLPVCASLYTHLLRAVDPYKNHTRACECTIAWVVALSTTPAQDCALPPLFSPM